VPRLVKAQYQPAIVTLTLARPLINLSYLGDLRSCPLGSLKPWRRAELCTGQTRTDQHRPAQTSTAQHRPAQTSTDQHRPVQTSTDQHRPAQTSTAQCRCPQRRMCRSTEFNQERQDVPFDLELRKKQNFKMAAWKGSPVTMGRSHFKLQRQCQRLVFIERELGSVENRSLYLQGGKSKGRDSGSAFFGE